MKKLALTVGDPSGVGPEIILNWAKSNPSYADKVCVIAHKALLEKLPKAFEGIQVGEDAFMPIAGEPSEEGARVAFDALNAAASGCKIGKFSAVTTAPISKANMRKIGFEYPGQTEFFEAAWGGDAVMCFAGVKFLVSLVTWHTPLRNVYSEIDETRVKAAVSAAAELARRLRGIEVPRIAVCGVNPHAGEDGLLGGEEKYIIDPLLQSMQKKYTKLSLCLPPDTVFMRTLKGEFDVIVAMYHDQGLTTLKAFEFDSAVNISMGLKYIRTSPDHGTGFSIAGKGEASFESFKNAVDCALKLSVPEVEGGI